MKSGKWLVQGLCVLFVLTLVASGASAAEKLLIRVEVDAPDGTHIVASAPLCLLETLKTTVIGPMKVDKEEITPIIDSLVSDFESLRGQDIIRVDAEAKIRVWVDEVDDDHPEEANFIQANVKPGGEDQPEIQIRIPKGLVFLASFVSNQFMETYGEQLFQQFQHMEHMKHMHHMNTMMVPPAPPVPPHPGEHQWQSDEPGQDQDKAQDSKKDENDEDGNDDEDSDDEEQETPNIEQILKEILEVLRELD